MRTVDEAREVDLREWLLNLWSGRYLILGSILVFLALGGLYIWRSTPIYQAEALLQIEPPKVLRDSDAAFARMENLFSAPSDATTEIEIIGSNMVLGHTVEALNLDVVAKPVFFPVIGETLARGKAHAPRIDVAAFDVPDSLRGLEFHLIALPNGTFEWKSPEDPPSYVKPGVAYPQDAVLAVGRPGDALSATYGGEALKLQVRALAGPSGQKFTLVRRPLLSAITDMRNDLEAAEKGVTQTNKSTNLLALAFRHTNPSRAAEILNEIMKQYIRQNDSRKGEEVGRTLALLQQQLPEVHARVEQAETRLNRFRTQTGAVDVPREADLALQQSSSLASQITALKQKKEELRRTYQEGSDVVATLNAQIAKLQNESAAVSQKVRTLPATQQELVRLSRDVQVNTELYTALLNNIQQLQVTRTGEGNNTRVVDFAMAGLKPVKPKKEMLLAVFFVLGTFVGISLLLGRRALQRGVEDHRIIEAKLGLPVFVTIPHSKPQEAQDRAIAQGQPGNHLLALREPDDVATESLRSLRTMLSFTMASTASRTIMLTGPSPKIGKSFITSNFSAVLAQAGARVLVVDADMRRGNLHKYFGLQDRLGGLSEVIAGLVPWKSAAHPTEIPGLHVMSTGELPKNPSELLMSPGFSAFVAEASTEYDYVVIDAPPVLPVTDATVIGSKVGTVLLVAKFGQHSLDELRACQNRLEASGIPLKGCVFNDLLPLGLGRYEDNYRYAYHYKYSRADNA
ncbi:polysaccharide biosynthesis tyrosine autokinase [Geothrix sp. 21YS21S-4]|uniref:polysaccharide biosynthesis tyrosine autokinase n=1 Tax=Geothrix sp. 21YS21S-4 TaxID=3068889 RepID=UPI0027BB0790|nr:polysaccharide biosynthesis tyrosine autokinase [Geothrix sp. 21YS21S-4]